MAPSPETIRKNPRKYGLPAGNNKYHNSNARKRLKYVGNANRAAMGKKYTPQNAEKFIMLMQKGFTITQAARAIGICNKTVYQWRDKYPDFNEAFEEAVEMSADLLEQEAFRRAVTGNEEPVYQKGEKVGTITKYSDNLLMMMLKGRKREVYGDKTEVTGPNNGPVQLIERVIVRATPELMEERMKKLVDLNAQSRDKTTPDQTSD